ncbi:MAG: ABC transporter permease [Bacteroidota bacterium]
MNLSSEHIDYIIKDLNYRGIVAEGVQDELIDHVCSAVETELQEGGRFIDAYHKVLHSFGHNSGLRETQKQILKTENKTVKLMLRNYMTIALRNLRKHSFYTFINVMGLAVSIASCLLIVLYITNELNFDNHHLAADRIYRVDTEVKFGGNHLRMATSPGPLAETLKAEYPEVENAGRLWSMGSMLIKRTDQNIKENDVILADSSILNVFTIPFIQGNPKGALSQPYSMIISQRTAEKYFPNENPVGQSLVVENKDSYKITGVYENMPPTSHFNYEIILSLISEPYHKNPQWLSSNFNTYIKLRQGADYKSLNAKLPAMVDKYGGPEAKAAFGADFTMEKFRAGGNKLEWTLRPLKDIHLYSDLTAELGVNSDITYIYLFGAIALFILAIACINFMNLSTARSANRAKEVGIRKVMGSLRSHLVRQFLSESILLSVFSFLVAMALAWMILPSFNALAGKQLFIPFATGSFWLVVIPSAVIIGIFAGIYPSFFLSSFRPVNVLKGNVSLGMKSGTVRSSLVVFQFSISILLIIGTIAVNRQLGFIQNKKIGFNKDQIIVIKDAYGMGNQLQSFKEEMLQDNRILSGTISGFLPVSNTNRSDNSHWPEGKQPTGDNLVALQSWRVDYDYVKTLGIKIKEGRDFSNEFSSDSTGVILNETAAKMFGYEKDPIGKKISRFGDGVDPGGFDPNKTKNFKIIGIVEDFHFESLKQNITPLALFLDKSVGLISFRFEAKNSKDVIESMEKTWKAMAPGVPFSYSFLDEDFGNMYSAEQRLGKIFTVFAGLAILIACLGLFALTSFTAEQRTKEIGIRKVLGASVSSIVLLLSKEFGKLIIIAFVLAAPLAWYGVEWWLKSYTYKADIGILVYLIAGISAFLVAWLTMSFQSFKAASNNPVKSLRSE